MKRESREITAADARPHEANFFRIKYLDHVIGLLLEARKQGKDPRLHLIDGARILLEEWRDELRSENGK